MTVSLDAALAGLRVAQQALDTASANIANASTPGYTRKILPQETAIINGSAVGVQSQTLVRIVDTQLRSSLNKQVSLSAGYSIQQKYFQRIQDFHGASDSGRSLSDQVAALANSFTQLSDSPDNQNLLNQTLVTAQQTAKKLNDFSTLITGLRQQTESDISAGITSVNASLDTIAQLNVQITALQSNGRSTADLEDQRDIAIKNVAQYLNITTFNVDNQITVMTSQGEVLADTASHKLYFQGTTLQPASFYPGGGLNGITVDSPSGRDITQTNLGGQIGALFTLRDQTLPTYNAQLDEAAHTLADRFQKEGLKLFVGADGTIPPNVADPAAVGYVGFATGIKVNDAVVNDPTLIRSGTTGNTELSGSNEVIRRVAQFVFGTTQYQQAASASDISGVVPLETLLGLSVNNRVTGSVDLNSYAPDISTLPGATFPGSFDITLGANPPVTVTVQSTDTAASIVANINAAVGSTVASVSSTGAIAFNYNGDITLADNSIGAPTFNAMGLQFGTTTMPNPSFQVQVGTRTPVTIQINPTDTSVELLAALNAVPGLTASLDANGHLVMQPTDGGDIKVVDTAGTPLATMGVTVANVPFTSMRQGHLGPNADLSTGLLANSTLTDYASSMIADQSEAANLNKTQSDQETSFLNTLDARNSNVSGVNVDQEMSDLIRIQAAYAASARMVSATQKIFEELIGAFQ